MSIFFCFLQSALHTPGLVVLVLTMCVLGLFQTVTLARQIQASLVLMVLTFEYTIMIVSWT